jgi:hypothetical protein
MVHSQISDVSFRDHVSCHPASPMLSTNLPLSREVFFAGSHLPVFTYMPNRARRFISSHPYLISSLFDQINRRAHQEVLLRLCREFVPQLSDSGFRPLRTLRDSSRKVCWTVVSFWRAVANWCWSWRADCSSISSTRASDACFSA